MSNTIRPHKTANEHNVRWDELPSQFFGQVALGNASQFEIGLMKVIGEDKSAGDYLLVSIVGVGCYLFKYFVHFAYLMEKMPSLLEGDAGNMADFINAQIGCVYPKEQGRYNPELCQ